MKKAVQKRYRLGGDISLDDANKILGLPANKPLSWQEFQDYAERMKIKHQAQNIDVKE